MPRKIGLGLIGAGLVLVAASALAVFLSGGDTVGRPELVEAEVRAASGSVVPSDAAAAEEPDAADSPQTVATVPASDDAPGSDGAGEAPADPPVSEPVTLRIDALDIDAGIDPYGVDAETRQMAVPDNVTDVAWYKFGPRPGAPGSAVLAAHVDLFGQGPGVFFDLGTLEVDDQVTVGYDDGSDQTFRVIARTVYDKDELPTDVIFAKGGPPVLTLITCGGGFSRSSRSYDSNVVVYAVPIGASEFPFSGSAD